MSAISFQDYFAALGARTTEPEHLKPFAAFCAAPNDSIETVANLMTATPDLPALLAGPNKQVYVVHHFLYDMQHALNPSASGKMFTLTGRNSNPLPAAIDPTEALAIPTADNRGLPVPLYETLAAAADVGAFHAAAPSTRNNSAQLTCRSLLAIPPFLASILMRADTTDPATLGILAIRALRDFDSRASQHMAEDERKDEEEPGWEQVEDPDGDIQWRRTDELASTIMADAVRFLWAASNGHVTSATIIPATSSKAEDWAASITRRCLARAVTPSPTGHRPAGTSPSDNTMVTLATSIAALTDQFAKQEDRLMEAKTEKEEKGFSRLPAFTRELILFVSGDVETTDPSGAVTTSPRTRPVQSYQDLLKLANVALAKQHLDYHLQTVHNCPTSVPMATALAITMGRFTWPNETVPDAFSIFAFAPMDLGGTTNPTDEFVHLQLKSDEGKGLSDADVARSTKVQHRLPRTEHSLGHMFAAFGIVLQVLFGEESDPFRAMQGWVKHYERFPTVYANLMHADAAFGARVLSLIDRGFQLYFRMCLSTGDTEVGGDLPGVRRRTAPDRHGCLHHPDNPRVHPCTPEPAADVRHKTRPPNKRPRGVG